ncbi:MAG: SRPBCC family protein [Gammaproteobacteria bacterium]|nr:SRPBCC family protein [Gammaproteobacteria bacterium]
MTKLHIQKPQFIYETYIRASAAQVWEALTSAEFTRQYFHATSIESTWEVGATVRYLSANGTAVEGEVLEIVPGELLSISWHVLYDEDAAKETASRVTFSIEALNDQTKLRIVHDSFPAASVVFENIAQGWPWIIASLKTLLETGDALPDATQGGS